MSRKNRKRDSDVAKSLKQEAQRLADLINESGSLKLSRARALEMTARIHGYRDWNTACKSVSVPNQPHDALQERCLQEAASLVDSLDQPLSPEQTPQYVDEVGSHLLTEAVKSQWAREVRDTLATRKQPALSDDLPRSMVENFIQGFLKEKGTPPSLNLSLEELSLGQFSQQGHEKARERTLRMMRASGAPEHIIYAVHKTGIIASEDTLHLLDPADVEKYQAASEEYFTNRGESYESFVEQQNDIAQQFFDDSNAISRLSVGWTNPSRHDYSHFASLFGPEAANLGVDVKAMLSELRGEDNPWQHLPIFSRKDTLDRSAVRPEEDFFWLHEDEPFVLPHIFRKEAGPVLLTHPFSTNGFLNMTIGVRLVQDRVVAGVIAISATAKMLHERPAWMNAEAILEEMRKSLPVGEHLLLDDFQQPFEPSALLALVLSQVLTNRADMLTAPAVDDGTFTIYFPMVMFPHDVSAFDLDKEALGNWYFDIIETIETERKEHQQARCYLPWIEGSVFDHLLIHSLDYYEWIPSAIGSRRFSDDRRVVEILSCEAPMMKTFARLSPDQRDQMRAYGSPAGQEIPPEVQEVFDNLKGLVDLEMKEFGSIDGFLVGFGKNDKGEETVFSYEHRGDALNKKAPIAIRQMFRIAPIVALINEVWLGSTAGVPPSEDPNKVDALAIHIFTKDGRTFSSASEIQGEPRKVVWKDIVEPIATAGRLALQSSGVRPVKKHRAHSQNSDNWPTFTRRLQ